jgi:hypothetical protein
MPLEEHSGLLDPYPRNDECNGDSIMKRLLIDFKEVDEF